MKRVLSEIQSRASAMDNHPFIALGNDASPEFAKERFKFWAPAFIHLSMTFRDVNAFLIPYENPKNKFEASINHHAQVDVEHWNYLLHDLEVLGLNNTMTLNDSIRFIWNNDYDLIRKYMYFFVSRCLRADACVFKRATVMESAEASVKIFFSLLQHSALDFSKKHNVDLQYFGPDHIESEMGEPFEANIFSDQKLDDKTLEECLQLVDEHFDKFDKFLSFKFTQSKDRPEFQTQVA